MDTICQPVWWWWWPLALYAAASFGCMLGFAIACVLRVAARSDYEENVNE